MTTSLLHRPRIPDTQMMMCVSLHNTLLLVWDTVPLIYSDFLTKGKATKVLQLVIRMMPVLLAQSATSTGKTLRASVRFRTNVLWAIRRLKKEEQVLGMLVSR